MKNDEEFAKLMESLGAEEKVPEEVAIDMLIAEDGVKYRKTWPDRPQGILTHDDGSKQIIVFLAEGNHRMWCKGPLRKLGDRPA